MANWRLHKTVSITWLVLTILALFGFLGILGIENLDSQFIGLKFSQVLAFGLIYVLWAFYNLINA